MRTDCQQLSQQIKGQSFTVSYFLRRLRSLHQSRSFHFTTGCSIYKAGASLCKLRVVPWQYLMNNRYELS